MMTAQDDRFISGRRLAIIAALGLVTVLALFFAVGHAIAYAALAQVAPAPAAPTFMAKALAWFAAAVGWLAIAVPSLITALSKDPITTPAATSLGALWNKVKHVLDFLSILSWKNVPNATLQLPLKLGRGKRGASAVLVMILALSMGAQTTAGCSWWSKAVAPVVTDVINCAKAEGDLVTAGKSVVTIALDIIGTITKAIADAGSADPATFVEAAAIGLYAQYGKPIVACVENDMALATQGTVAGAAHAKFASKFKFAPAAK